jgi:hypothetical protein
VENARHDLLFCLDSDNILAPSSVPRLVEYMQQTRADAASFQQLHYFVSSPLEVTHKWTFKPGLATLADYLAGPIVPGASGNYLFTRDSWVRAQGYPEFAGALDAWGFGLRQVGARQKVMVMPDGHYHHRYGHESYWVRDARRGHASLVALQLLIPFLSEIDERDVDYIMSRQGRSVWFDRLSQRPLRLKSGEPGGNGVIEGDVRVSPPDPGFARRVASALARRLGVR